MIVGSQLQSNWMIGRLANFWIEPPKQNVLTDRRALSCNQRLHARGSSEKFQVPFFLLINRISFGLRECIESASMTVESDQALDEKEEEKIEEVEEVAKNGDIMEEVDDEVIWKSSQPYQCDFCDYSGPRNLDLMDHVDKVLPDDPKGNT
jgi:hypothetical protein